jgi:hypothetical protein
MLKEFELAQAKAQSLEDNIWKTAAAFGLGSMGTLVVLASQSLEGPPHWFIVLVVGFFVFAVNQIWWGMACRWWEIQHVVLLRMRHIEGVLDMKRETYIHDFDKITKADDGGKDESIEKELRDLSRTGSKGVQGSLNRLRYVVLLTWVAYVLWACIADCWVCIMP